MFLTKPSNSKQQVGFLKRRNERIKRTKSSSSIRSSSNSKINQDECSQSSSIICSSNNNNNNNTLPPPVTGCRELRPVAFGLLFVLSFIGTLIGMCKLFEVGENWNKLTTRPADATIGRAGGVDHCYSDIGCFPLSEEFYHPRHRPFNVRPWHRRHIGIQFELFNGQHPGGFAIRPWNRFSLAQSQFDPKLETKIIVPGWLDNVDRAVWVRQLRDALLWLWAPSNIIVVRWRNFTPYTIATANTRVVGAELANLIKFIEHELHYDRSYYHLIGHSLGAHISGYCGDRVPGLGRITALDPARPFFQGMPKSVRLDRADAKFVDAIHSDFTPENAILLFLMSFGMTTPVGHVDFYPNGPPLLQPGCFRDTLDSIRRGIINGLRYNSLSVAFLEAGRYLTACDHQRSHEWFLESIINRQCVFVGVRCDTYEGLINGRCTCDDSPSACAIMGIHADQMYLNNVHNDDAWPLSKWAPASILRHHHHHHNRSPSREQTYGRLKLEASKMRLPPEPSISSEMSLISAGGLADDDDDFAVGQESAMAPTLGHESPVGHMNTKQPIDNWWQQVGHEAQQDTDFLASQAQTFEDVAFADYLRIQTLLHKSRQPPSSSQPIATLLPTANNADDRHVLDADHQAQINGSGGGGVRRRQDLGWPEALVGGHARLVSDLDRNIENWYEHSSRWYLKTNNRPNYCANQYQILVFLGPIRVARKKQHHDGHLRANLIISIIGSRGQLLNQRFVPRSTKLDSFTMQPFFILLEGSYSLGHIKSVALAWEARQEPDAIQATVSFQNNKLAQMQAHVPALKAKHPLVSETTNYDHSHSYQFAPPPLPLPQLRRRRQADGGVPNLSAPTKDQQELISRRMDDDDEHWRLSSISSSLAAGGADCQLDVKLNKCSISYQGSRRRTDVRTHLGSLHQVATVSDFDNDEDLDYAADNSGPNEEPPINYISPPPPPPPRPLPPANYFHHELLGQPKYPIPWAPNVGEREQSLFEPLIEPLISSSQLVNKQQALQDDGQITFKLNNIDLLLAHQHHAEPRPTTSMTDNGHEESIVIHRVVVSPLQANYGQARASNAKSFCSPRVGLRLRRDQTVKLKSSITGQCH